MEGRKGSWPEVACALSRSASRWRSVSVSRLAGWWALERAWKKQCASKHQRQHCQCSHLLCKSVEGKSTHEHVFMYLLRTRTWQDGGRRRGRGDRGGHPGRRRRRRRRRQALRGRGEAGQLLPVGRAAQGLRGEVAGKVGRQVAGGAAPVYELVACQGLVLRASHRSAASNGARRPGSCEVR